ncbi:MAG TPA: GNAT family N-acetyltransferase [Myxococcaceae bacterium]|nr:GNAT family N-acetyltransferase [Myxococcaceae bacterium]
MELEVERVEPDSPEAGALLEAYFLELRDRLAPSSVDVVRRWPEDFRGPRGAVVLARADGRAVGCAGLRPLGEGVVELKHFFLAREARGRGLGRAMLAGVEEVARERGARRILLDTAAPLIEAAALYRSAGYADIPRFNDNPVAVAWFGRDVGPR